MAALPLVVFTYATGPYEEWHRLAWATALVLILVVCVLSIAARLGHPAEVLAAMADATAADRRPSG